MTTQELLLRARGAKDAMAMADTQTKDRALLAMADALEAEQEDILAANAQDLEQARGTVSDVMLDRLALSPERIRGMAQGIREVAALPDPVGEVLARVEAQLRRVQKFSAPPERRQFVCGDLVLDREEFSVTAGGEPVVLTAREFEILALLMEYPKRVFTREQIYQHVWGEEYFGDDNTVNVHISNLRAKLGRVSDREYIKTVWGIGFKMAEP